MSYHFLFITLCALALGSCERNIVPYGYDRGMTDGAPNGTPTFRSGWKDGCESGFTVMPSGHMKIFHNFTFNAHNIVNQEYFDAWFLGFNHCRWYGNAWYRQMS